MLLSIPQISSVPCRTIRPLRTATILLCAMTAAFCLISPASYSQNPGNKVSFAINKDTLVSGNGQINEFTLQLINPTGTVFTGSVIISPDPGVELISKNKASLQLQPGEQFFIATKLIMPRKMRVSQLSRVRVTLLNVDGQPEQENSVFLKVTASRSVSLNVGATELLLKRSNDSLHIPVRLTNEGNTDQRILVVTSFPAILKKSSNLQQLFVLPAFTDTMIWFHKRITSEMFKTDGFYITVTGLYYGSDAFGSRSINAQPAKSSRSFVEITGTENEGPSNSLTVLGQNLGTKRAWYQAQSSGNLNIRKQQVEYNLDATYFSDYGMGQKVQLRNSFLTYRKDDWGVTVGSIGRNYDINISGRGMMAFMTDSARTHYAEAGYIDKNQNLITGFWNSKFQPNPGNAAWASYGYTSRNIEIRTAAVHDINSFSQMRTLLLVNQFSWMTKKNYRINAVLNGGKENSLAVKDSSRMGLGGELNFEGTFGKFYVNSNNSLSSQAYPGLTKGALTLNERISWLKQKFSTWAAFTYSNISPAPIPGASFALEAKRFRVESGLSFLLRRINISASPNYTYEKSNAFQVPGSMQSYHLAFTANYVSPLASKSFFLNSEAGFYSSSFESGTHFHQRTMCNLRYSSFFNLSAVYQSGNYYMFEVINSKGKQNSMISISPQFHKDILSHRGRIQAGISYINGTNTGVSIQSNSRIEYDYSLKMKLFAGADYNYYKSTNYQYLNLSAGVTFRLPQARTNTKNGNTLEVLLYKDINDNGVYDKEDSLAENAYVTINNMIFITGSDGLVKYKKLPEGYYRINVAPLKGWFGQEKLIPTLDKDTRIEIPLQRTGVVKGSISYLFTRYSYETSKNKDGVFISATNSRGARFTTMTNMDGQFIFYLPAGEYNISLKKEGMPEEIESLNDYAGITVSPQQVVQADFALKVKERKVETKKFSSPSLTASAR